MKDYEKPEPVTIYKGTEEELRQQLGDAFMDKVLAPPYPDSKWVQGEGWVRTKITDKWPVQVYLACFGEYHNAWNKQELAYLHMMAAAPSGGWHNQNMTEVHYKPELAQHFDENEIDGFSIVDDPDKPINEDLERL